MEVGDLITLSEAAELARMGRNTLRRRLTDAAAPMWCDPSDNRRRMIRREDLERIILKPRPVVRPRKEARAA